MEKELIAIVGAAGAIGHSAAAEFSRRGIPIAAAAAADPDARPMTPDELRKAKHVPRTKTLRRALGLTQEEFAVRFHIPIGTLRDWEQGRCVPDQPARAYLTVIARDPESVQRALHGRPS